MRKKVELRAKENRKRWLGEDEDVKTRKDTRT
jgi:hypothetical protein